MIKNKKTAPIKIGRRGELAEVTSGIYIDSSFFVGSVLSSRIYGLELSGIISGVGSSIWFGWGTGIRTGLGSGFSAGLISTFTGGLDGGLTTSEPGGRITKVAYPGGGVDAGLTTFS